MGDSYLLQDQSYLVHFLEWKDFWNDLVIITQPCLTIRKAQDIVLPRELECIFQFIHKVIVNLLKTLKRSEKFYIIMDMKSLDKNLIPYVALKHPVFLSLFFFCIEVFV